MSKEPKPARCWIKVAIGSQIALRSPFAASPEESTLLSDGLANCWHAVTNENGQIVILLSRP
ncbi:MAG: hypothetical protein WBQ10_05430, partial [Terriglobales bacterium]